MKYAIIILLLLLSCNSNLNKLDNIESFISNEQKEALIKALNHFDLYLKNKYPFENDPNERIFLFINDHENAFFTLEKGIVFSKSFSKELESFNPYLKELENTGFYNLIKTSSYHTPSEDFRVIKWIDSIDQSYIDNSGLLRKTEKGSNLKILDTIFQNSISQLETSNNRGIEKRYIGYRNIFFYGLFMISKANSFEKDIILESVNPIYNNYLIGLKDPTLRKNLSNPIVKTYVFYTTIIRKYDLHNHCICFDK